VDGAWTFSSAESTATITAYDTFVLHIDIPGTVPQNNPTIPAPDYRCDSSVSAYPGCVVPEVAPTLALNRNSTVGDPAVAFFEWAQTNLPDHWGSRAAGSPLHRLTDDAQANANRNKACKNYVSNGGDDTCDEFPFARTYESTTASASADCVEYNPTNQSPIGAARCAWAHMPSSPNFSVGGSYSTFIQDQRLLDNDAFYIDFVSA
jgi:hypothetical protein